MEKYKVPTVLSIAGFDGSGGAGIQADTKTISALGGYAMNVLTALPVQNTQGVRNIYDIPT
ncbi:bifunctional hydroxymethylpyrimidine kinase/phosphomethylpyrimidine kinase, partial [Brucella sp. 21LCYQ03]|nr:bifunctional hydroxymethylpyrimidine kinase/phosphomethylpyrimidine kinase [Brucella sp. 21LCYQ03]